LRCPYRAKVMKTLDTTSSTMGLMAGGSQVIGSVHSAMVLLRRRVLGCGLQRVAPLRWARRT
jgi:hypothetical protein